MGDSDHDDVLIVHDIDDLVREPTDSHAADLERGLNPFDRRAGPWSLGERLHRLSHFEDEFRTKAVLLPVVPLGRLVELLGSAWVEPDPAAHPLESLPRIRCSTVSQSSVTVSPESTP